MKSFLALIIIFYSFSSSINSQSREFYVKYYSTEDGLPSNSIKDVIQDGKKFIWIATDAGVSKFDALNFYNYNDELQSSYVKDLFSLKTHGVIAVTDLGLELLYPGNPEDFSIIINGSTDETDSLVFYPKSVFVDSKNNFWISETNNISRIKNNKFQKFFFEPSYFTNDYKRSYLFQEIDDIVLATSWRGYLFYFDSDNEKFINIPFPSEGRFFINSFEKYNNKVLFGTNDGIYELSISGDFTSAKIEKLLDLRNVSCIFREEDEAFLIGTFGQGLFKFNMQNGKLNKIDEVKDDYINSISQDDNQGYWIGTDNGVYLLKKNIFRTLDLKQVYDSGIPRYISQLKLHKNKMYFSTGLRLFEIIKDKKNFTYKEFSHLTNVQDFIISEEGCWVSSQDGQLSFYDNNWNLIFTKKLEDGILGRLCLDKNGYLWVFGVVTKHLYRINEQFEIKIFDKEDTKGLYIEIIKELADGNIYIAGNNHNFRYLLKYDNQKHQFSDLKVVNSDTLLEYAHVFDLDMNKIDKSIILATSEGALQYKDNAFSKYMSGTDIENTTTRAVYWEAKNIVWLGTDKGLFITKGKEFALYNNYNGLPSSTISAKCIVEDSEKNIWVGTVSGLTFLTKHSESIIKSKTPVIVKKEFNKKVKPDQKEFLQGINIKLYFSNLDIPDDKTIYSFRISGLDSNWTNPSTENSVMFTHLPTGNYSFQVRAKNQGKIWSEYSNFEFSIIPHWYYSKLMFVVYIIILSVVLLYLIFVVQKINTRSIERRRKELEDLVNLRTKELKKEKLKTDTLLDQMQQDRAKLYSIMDNSPDLISFKSETGIYLTCNDSFSTFFNISKENIIGATDYDIYEKGIAETIIKNDQELRISGQNQKYEQQLIKNDEKALFEFFRTLIIDENKNKLGILTVAHDITQMKDAESKLHEYAELQKELLREVNHRIKNNLSSLISILHLEEDKERNLEDYDSLIPEIINRIRNMSVVHELLSLNSWKPMKISELCHNIISGSISAMAAKGKISFNISESEIIVSNDYSHKLGMVINELATNSIKHFKNKNLEIKLYIEISEKADDIQIIYKDNGSGFCQEIIDGDFSKFNIGMELITGIIEHSLGGEVIFRNSNGAITEMIIPKEYI